MTVVHDSIIPIQNKRPTAKETLNEKDWARATGKKRVQVTLALPNYTVVDLLRFEIVWLDTIRYGTTRDDVRVRSTSLKCP